MEQATDHLAPRANSVRSPNLSVRDREAGNSIFQAPGGKGG